MRRKNILLGICVVALAGIAVWAPEVGWNTRRLASGNIPRDSDALMSLRAENARLKTERALLESLARHLPRASSGSIPAFVYARDPFNLIDEILLSAGEAQGVRVGDAVAVDGFLAGEVVTVYPARSLARTIFDSRFKSAVRVGAEGAEALLEGGNEPRLALINREAVVAEGDPVYSAAERFPYGIPMGTMKNLRNSKDELFKEADLEAPYRAQGLAAVLILAR